MPGSYNATDSAVFWSIYMFETALNLNCLITLLAYGSFGQTAPSLPLLH